MAIAINIQDVNGVDFRYWKSELLSARDEKKLAHAAKKISEFKSTGAAYALIESMLKFPRHPGEPKINEYLIKMGEVGIVPISFSLGNELTKISDGLAPYHVDNVLILLEIMRAFLKAPQEIRSKATLFFEPNVLKCLDTREDIRIPKAAAVLLGEMKSENAVSPLIERIIGAGRRGSKDYLLALEKINGETTKKKIFDRLLNTSMFTCEDPDTPLVDVLKKYTTKEDAKQICSFLPHPKFQTSTNAARLLVDIATEEIVPDLISALGYHTFMNPTSTMNIMRSSIVLALEHAVGRKRARSLVFDAFYSKSEDVRFGAICALDARTIREMHELTSALKPFLEINSDPKLRSAALHSLSNLTIFLPISPKQFAALAEDTLDPLIAILQKTPDGSNFNDRQIATLLISEFADERAIPALISLLNPAEEPAIASCAIKGLSKFPREKTSASIHQAIPLLRLDAKFWPRNDLIDYLFYLVQDEIVTLLNKATFDNVISLETRNIALERIKHKLSTDNGVVDQSSVAAKPPDVRSMRSMVSCVQLFDRVSGNLPQRAMVRG